MRTSHAFISLSVVLTCVTLVAQEAPRAAGGGLADRFKQLDRNGDGKVSAEEARGFSGFTEADANGDGFVTLDELRARSVRRRIATPQPNPTPPTLEKREIVSTLDVRYASIAGVDPNLLSLDIHAPNGAKNAPVIVFFHGGGWHAGDKRNFGRLAESFVAAGYVFVSGNYRLSPPAVHPQHVQDVAAALAYVHDHIAKHGGDPNRVFVTGHSAGAHLASLAAVDDRPLKAAGKDLRFLKGAILLDAAGYDLPAYLAGPDAAKGMVNLIHQAFGKTEAGWRDASPTAHVAPGKGIPPFLILHGGTKFGSDKGAPLLAEKLNAVGSPSKAVQLAKTHGEFVLDLHRPDDPMTKLVMEFLATHSGGSTAITKRPESSATDVAPATPGAKPNLHAETPNRGGSLAEFIFTADYYAGNEPAGSPLAGATEANALEIHNDLLYCATSYMPPSRAVAEVNPKVLVKKSATSRWEVDLEAGSEFMRLGFMKSVAFTTDGHGNRLPKPVSVLIAGTGAWRSQTTGVVVFSRNDATGKWTKTLLSPDRWNREKRNHTTEVRCLFDHVDRVTGVHYVFAGAGTGRVYRGVYDPSQPGLIAWDAQPELDDLIGRFTCAAEANGLQYVGVAYGAAKEGLRGKRERPVKDHGLFRRVDGPNARWEWVPVKEWEDPQHPGRSLRIAQLRGMTAVPAPDGKGEVLLVARDAHAEIERIDPRNGFKVTVELNVRDFLTKQWGRRVGINTFAYNDMLPVSHAVAGEKAHLIGLRLMHPDGEDNEPGKSSWYLVRYADGSYRYQRIWDENNPLTNATYGLRGCRSIRPSPFPEEAGHVWYFCGFDQQPHGAKDAGATGPAAWIYKGTLKAKP